MPFTLGCTSVIPSLQRHLTDYIYDYFLLVLLTLMSLNCSRLSCQSRLLLRWQGSSLPPPWPPLCWSLSRRRWWLDRLAGVWSRQGSPRYVSMAITLSAIKINCCRLMPLTVVIVRAAFTSVFTVSIIRSVIITFPSGRLQCTVVPLLQTLMNHLWFGKSLKEAIAAPVVFVDSQNALKFEPKFDMVIHSMPLFDKVTHHPVFVLSKPPLLFSLQEVIEALKALGHNQETANHFYNVVNAVEKEDGCICAVSDARKLGQAAGYWDRESVALVMQDGLKVTETFLLPQTHKSRNRWYLSCWKIIVQGAEGATGVFSWTLTVACSS